MFDRVFRLQSVIGFVAIALVLGACANKDDVSPAENQAKDCEDLRNEIRNAVR